MAARPYHSRHLRAALLALAGGLLAPAALAHPGAYQPGGRLIEAAAVAVAFSHADGTPAAEVDYQAFGPEGSAQPFQTGRTDRLGRATFLPHQPGRWQIVLRDATGQGASASIEVGADAAPRQSWHREVLRASLLLNALAMAVGAFLWTSRRRSTPVRATPAPLRSPIVPKEA